ncbi:MAG: Clostripain precursor [bacterium ADurb.Bin243]|nr:MAG: Clostripain precursor [bacterium ADurb.Bin243]
MKKLGFIVALMAVVMMASTVFAAEKAQWTMMVFINADNNLDRFGVIDVQEMEKAGLSKDVNIVVQLDRFNKETRRYDVTGRAADAKADDWGLTSNMVQKMGEVDMGDYKEMVNFVKWSAETYPAEKYLLVIWNHGAGWKKRNNEIFKGISYDDQSHNHITTAQLGTAMQSIAGVLGKQLDILAMDACLMQMVEVLYEVRENVTYMVASEETEPGDGWPYHLVCPPLTKNPAMSALEFAKLIPQAYAQSYPSKSTTQSAVELAKMDVLAEAINKFAVALMNAINTPAEAKIAKDALNVVQKYAYPENVDLGHIVKLICDKTADAKVKEAGAELLMAYEKAIVQNNITGYSTKNSTGIAIFFPKSGWNSNYSTIKFSEYKWDEMVQALMKAAVPAPAVTEAPAAPAATTPSNNSYNSGNYYPSYPNMPGMPGVHPHWPPLDPMIY